MESHFTVIYNHITQTWEIDSEGVRYPDGQVFDSENQEWSEPNPKSPEGRIDNEAFIALSEALRALNGTE